MRAVRKGTVSADVAAEIIGNKILYKKKYVTIAERQYQAIGRKADESNWRAERAAVAVSKASSLDQIFQRCLVKIDRKRIRVIQAIPEAYQIHLFSQHCSG